MNTTGDDKRFNPGQEGYDPGPDTPRGEPRMEPESERPGPRGLIDPGPITDTISALYRALAKAQGEFPDIPKNRTANIRPREGNAWSFKYSDLADLIKATRPGLAKNGLGFYQFPINDWKVVETVIFHESGATINELYPVKHRESGSKMHPGQDFAISWALARRYALSAMLGVAAEETIEGDKGGQTAGKNFDDPTRDGKVSVRGAKVKAGADEAETAKEYARAVEVLFNACKTQKSLDGEWSRNEAVINRLQDAYPSIYANLLDAFEVCRTGFAEGEG